ncbi:YfhO family protein [Enterococcus sp. HY326]|uniref:YfhO family protein n=1 Tax=Enterococcus sp. HY326 TaxID=2971265 RepID=UPI00223FF5EF|nr:YfhO family protein [Enterococcus sp. HY326]
MKKVSQYLKKEGLSFLLSFLIPIGIMVIVYNLLSIYPGSQRTVMASDSFSQYSVFHAFFNQMIKEGDSVLFNWSGSLGLNNWSFMSYYLSGIFTPLVLFFQNNQIPDFLYFYTLLKFGLMGLSFSVYCRYNFRLGTSIRVGLSVAYALMSFMVATSEIIMWFDALIYLPLIIWGIHRLVQRKKPVLLFVSYVLMFLSNFYMAFMVGLFSFLYFVAYSAIDFKQRKSAILPYLGTAFAAGGTAMPLLLPVLLDLTQNGESFTPITNLITDSTGPLDLLLKNFVGVYDTTKFGSIPFLSIGLVALIFGLFFFITKKISRNMKLAFGCFLGIILLSFYLEPLNLLWQGMHAPNMFLFRFSFVFSFLLINLAAYALEVVSKEDWEILSGIIIVLVILFTGVKLWMDRQEESYIYGDNYLWTIGFLLVYFELIVVGHKFRWQKIGWLLLTLVMIGEAGINTFGIIRGVAIEWNYATGELYTKTYAPTSELVALAKAENQDFFRMENVTASTPNDSFLYGYHGVSMFSSIRNRHSSAYLDSLGFRSHDTNLNIRYINNTILMDSILGIQYNLSHQPLSKFGYQEIEREGDLGLYENEYVLPLGILTDDGIYQDNTVENQSQLFNQLAGTNQSLFDFEAVELVDSQNVTISEETVNTTTLQALEPDDIDEPIELTYRAEIPAGKQAYFSAYFSDRIAIGNPYLTLKLDEAQFNSSLMDGQYYNLGSYSEAETIEFTIEISNLMYEGEEQEFEWVKPDMVLIDHERFVSSYEQMAEKGVELAVEGSHVTGSVAVDHDQVLFTTIPYDKGWTAYINGEKVVIPLFKEAFLTLPLSAGKNQIELVFFPQGLKVGFGLAAVSLIGFVGTVSVRRKKR